MKIKTKLIISFCMVIFLPVSLAIFCAFGFFNLQSNMLKENQRIENYEDYWFNSESLNYISKLMDEKYKEIEFKAQINPSFFEKSQQCDTLNNSLNSDIYMIVEKENKITYNGGKNNEDVLKKLSELTTGKSEKFKESLDTELGLYVRSMDFIYNDGSQGTICLVAKVNNLVKTKTVIVHISLAILLILLLTASMMILWIYQSIIAPIKKLQTAAENIKEGNLDFVIEPVGSDEIAELSTTFEAMRQRLRDNATEKVDNENENRALISNIAHDLKTPITAVKGYSEGILDGVANTPEKIEKYVRTIYNKANEMDTLINELTLYTKYDTNRIPYNFAKIGVAEYFDDCVSEIVVDLEEKHIGLAYNNYVEDDVIIIVDPEQLRRVINNIISNSVKYMDRQEGFVNIRIKDVGEFVQVEIEDNGKGIEQKSLPYIFDRFYRADASRNSKTGGSGIGLSIVKKIIEDHGGKIWATSKEGTGTTMYFVIHKFQEVKEENE